MEHNNTLHHNQDGRPNRKPVLMSERWCTKPMNGGRRRQQHIGHQMYVSNECVSSGMSAWSSSGRVELKMLILHSQGQFIYFCANCYAFYLHSCGLLCMFTRFIIAFHYGDLVLILCMTDNITNLKSTLNSMGFQFTCCCYHTITFVNLVRNSFYVLVGMYIKYVFWKKAMAKAQ